MNPRPYVMPKMLLAAAALALLPAHALDITGFVSTKLDAPISGAKVCIKPSATQCVFTGTNGIFHIGDGNIGVNMPAPRADGFLLELNRGGLSLTAPFAAEARVEWTDAGGRNASAERGVRLGQGRNALPLPEAMRRDGLCFLRISAGGVSLAWKVVLLGSSGAATRLDRKGSGVRALALSKAMAAPAALEVSKAGYRTQTYNPRFETENNASIILAAEDDSSLAFTRTYTTKVLAIDTAGKKLILEKLDPYCFSDTPGADTLQDTSRYMVKGGKMYVWKTGECNGEILTGTGSSPLGAWTADEFFPELPADLKTADCRSDSSAKKYAITTSFKETSSFTGSQRKDEITVELCPGQIYESIFDMVVFEDSTVTKTKSACKELDYTNGKGESAKVAFSQKGDSIHSEFVYKTKVCELTEPFGLVDFADPCPANDDPLGPITACLEATGFSTPDPSAQGTGKK